MPSVAKQPRPSNDSEADLIVAEQIITSLLAHVKMRDGMGLPSDQFCIGCWRIRAQHVKRSCVEAREFLAFLREKRGG